MRDREKEPGIPRRRSSPAPAPGLGAAGGPIRPRRETPAVGRGRAPLMLGECVQGRQDDGLDFLITAPVHRFSTARFLRDRKHVRLTVRPTGYWKSLRAVRQWLSEQGLPAVGRLEVHTELPFQHGFGTSTADITASLRAAADAWRRPMPPQEISRIAIGIEPTDGSMYPQSVAYAHRCGRLLERLGPLPRFTALVTCDQEGVDTVEFEIWRISKDGPSYARSEISQLRDAWRMVRQACRTNDVALLGRACQTSARINERILPKPFYQDMHELLQRGVGEGLITAHSGSAIALLLDPGRPDYRRQRARALARLKTFAHNGWMEVSNFAPPNSTPAPAPPGAQSERRAARSSASSAAR